MYVVVIPLSLRIFLVGIPFCWVKAKELLSQFVQSQQEYPKKSLKILKKIFKDNIQGSGEIVRPLKIHNKTLQERIFQFEPLRQFLNLAGYKQEGNEWIVWSLLSVIWFCFWDAISKPWPFQRFFPSDRTM